MLLIRNKGEIESEALTLLGATTKRNDDSKIGYFGSGNKYAIATLLRKGIGFSIYSGEKEYRISTKIAALRGQEYDRIYINDEATSMTTDMGPDWETWFTLREFVCNAMDEGEYSIDLGTPVPEEGYTLVAIEETPEVLDFFNNRTRYILDKDPIHEVNTHYGKVGIYPTSEFMNIYRKLISVMPTHGYTSAYDYNFEKLDINESRVYKYEFQVKERIAAFFAYCQDEEIVNRFINHQEGYESDLRWGEIVTFSDPWRSLLKDRTIGAESQRMAIGQEDRWTVTFLQDGLVTALKKAYPTLRYVGEKNESGWVEAEEVVGAVADKVQKVLDTLSSIDISTDTPVKLGCFQDSHVIACFNREANEIRVSLDYTEDEDELEITLFEEIMHTKGYADNSRHFEYYLMKEIIKARKKNRLLDMIAAAVEEGKKYA